mgnify:CR=1 FL=1
MERRETVRMPAAKKWPKPVISEVADVLGIRRDWITIREEMRSAGVDHRVLWEQSWERFLDRKSVEIRKSERTSIYQDGRRII